MTQPKFAPIRPNDEVRSLSKLPPPGPWTASRPADFRAAPGAARRPGRGTAGPDQGYAMLLAERFADRISLVEGEHLEDVLRGASVIALRRAAIFGRAPVAADVEIALRLFGFIGGATDEIIALRRAAFGGVAHSYTKERELADLVPESTLRLSTAAFAEQLGSQPATVLAGIAAS